MRGKTVAVVLAGALIAAGLVIAALVSRSKPTEDARLRAELARSQNQVHGLTSEMASLRRELETRPASALPVIDESGALRRRIAELEGEVEVLKKRPEPAVVGKLVPAPLEQTEAEALRTTAVALDASRAAAERVKALESLRLNGRITPEVAAAMVQLFESSSEPGMRADILRHLHRSLPQGLAGSVVRALQTDPDRKVREEAAETLGPLRDDPSIRAALEHASRQDPDGDVRAQAQKSLSPKRR